MKFTFKTFILGIFALFAIASSVAFASATYNYTTNWFYQGSPVSSVRAITYICPDAGCTTLGAEIDDQSLAGNSVTIRYPIPAPANGFASYVFSPGYIYQEMAWRPTGDGAWTDNIQFTKKANAQAAVNSFVVSSNSINENQQLTATANVQSSLSEVNVAPYAEPADADIVQDYFSMLTRVTFTVTNAGTGAVVYTDVQTGYILWDSAMNFNFAWTPDFTQAGSYSTSVMTEVIDSKASNSVTVYSNPTSVTVNNANRVPQLATIGNRAVDEGANLAFNLVGVDADGGDVLTYSAVGLPAGATLDANTGAFSWTPSNVQGGTYSVTFTVNDGNGGTDSETITITVNDVLAPIADVSFPLYSNIAENPVSPATYAPAQNYVFSSTWTDNIGIASVTFEFNGINYVPTALGGGDYSFTVSDLAAGSYTYRWSASDAAGNTNQTALATYTIDQAVPPLSINIQPSSPVTNGTETNVTGLGCPAGLTCELYRDGTLVTNPDVANLSVGNYIYIFNTTGNENYTAFSVTDGLSVRNETSTSEDETEGGDIKELTDNQFANGYTLTLYEGDRIKFNFCGAPYYLRLTEIDDDKARFSLTPGGVIFNLEEDDSEEIDLDLNGIDDIKVKVEDLTDTRAKVYVKRISTICAGAPAGEKVGLEVYGGAEGTKLPEKKAFSFWDFIESEYGILTMLAAIFVILLVIFAVVLRKATAPRKRSPTQININSGKPIK